LRKITVCLLSFLLIFAVLPIQQCRGDELFEYVAGIGSIGNYYFANGTKIPTVDDVFYETINGTTYRVVYSPGFVLNKVAYNPNETALGLNFTGIVLYKAYYKSNEALPEFTKETIVHGYVSIYILLSQEFPLPRRIVEVLENGTVLNISFSVKNVTVIVDGVPKGHWNITFTIYFSNPLVVIYGEEESAKFPTTLYWLLAGTAIIVVVVIAWTVWKKYH